MVVTVIYFSNISLRVRTMKNILSSEFFLAAQSKVECLLYSRINMDMTYPVRILMQMNQCVIVVYYFNLFHVISRNCSRLQCITFALI